MSKQITKAANVQAFEDAGVTQQALATGDFDSYQVRGKPGTGKSFPSLDDAIQHAKKLGVRSVYGVRHTYGKMGSGVFMSAVWVDGAR